MKEEDFIKILPMYIGVDIGIFDNIENPEFPAPATLEGFDIMNVTEPVIAERTHFKLSVIKLYLRPLSDITKEETNEWRSGIRKCAKNNIGILEDGFACHSAFHDAWGTAYLISKRFDIFNLIPNGFAIDKTKSKQ
jgi:hypothetical protein